MIHDIKTSEGFRGMPYKDHLGFDTIGYGTKLPIDEEEGEMLLRHRMGKSINELRRLRPEYNSLPDVARDIIDEMIYQLGAAGVGNFSNMWLALREGNYMRAAAEMLDSLWAKQTPSRAKRLAKRMGDIV